MFRERYHKTLILSIIMLITSCKMVFAFEDGFATAKKISGKHFTIFCAPGVDVSSLLEQLNIGAADRVLAGKTPETRSSPEQELAEMIDTLFIRICDILDMRLYSFEGNIKICRDQSQSNQIYKNLFDRDIGGQRSFYVYSLNTIYIPAHNLTREILGHEIAHAVISRYFVVLPSVKIQEVLAGYAEYQLRKYQVSEETD